MPEFTITAKRPVVVMDVAEYEELMDRIERLEFLGDESLQKDIDDAMKALREGRTTSLEEYDRKRLARRAVTKD